MARSEDMLLAIALHITIASCIALPLYIYGVRKWHHFQSHFMVTKRFPRISNLIVIIAFITMLNEIIHRWLDYASTSILHNDEFVFTFLRSVGQANVFLISSLSVFRLMLIYQRWKKCQYDITQFLEHKPPFDLSTVPPRSSFTANHSLHVPDHSPSLNGIANLQRVASLSPPTPTPKSGHTNTGASNTVTVNTVNTVNTVHTANVTKTGVLGDTPISHPTASGSSRLSLDSVPTFHSMPSVDILYGADGSRQRVAELERNRQTSHNNWSSMGLMLDMFMGYIFILSGKFLKIPPAVLAMVWFSLILTAVAFICLIKWRNVQEGTLYTKTPRVQ